MRAHSNILFFYYLHEYKLATSLKSAVELSPLKTFDNMLLHRLISGLMCMLHILHVSQFCEKFPVLAKENFLEYHLSILLISLNLFVCNLSETVVIDFIDVNLLNIIRYHSKTIVYLYI